MNIPVRITDDTVKQEIMWLKAVMAGVGDIHPSTLTDPLYERIVQDIVTHLHFAYLQAEEKDYLKEEHEPDKPAETDKLPW